MTVELNPAPGTARTLPLRTQPQPDGSFVFRHVPPGIWDINVGPLAKGGGFIKSMRLGEQDVLIEEMEIGLSPPAPLHIVVSSRGGQVSGRLAGEAAKEATAFVLLAPEEKYQHVMSFYAMAPVGADGTFSLAGITPGRYRLYALEMVRTPVDLRNPEILSRLNEHAEVLVIGEAARVVATPKLIPAQRIQEVLE
jgi:hypothetical protein